MKKIFALCCLMAVTFLATSCSQDMELSENQGYLSLKINTLVSTTNPDGTRSSAPSNYAPKQLHVEIINEAGSVVMSTNDFANDPTFNSQITLTSGNYTIRAYSNGWDGSGSGFGVPYYYGTTNVDVMAKNLQTARVTCTLANVKVTVEYDQSFVDNFNSATTTVSSAKAGVNPLSFVMGQTTQSGYFPVANLTAQLDVQNKRGESHSMTREITDVKARNHYILKYKVADSGNLGDGTTGGINVTVDESTQTYTYTFEVPKTSGTAFTTYATNAWSTFAYINAAIASKTSEFDAAGLTLQWKKATDATWNDVPSSALTIDSEDKISYKLTGLTAKTDYEYRLHYVKGDDEVNSETASFTTDVETEIYNGSFESWYTSGKIQYPNESGKTYWDTSNPPSAKYIGSITTSTTEMVHSGQYAAKLTSKWAVVKFAAASLYTGKFDALVGINGAKLYWGTPFEGRPTSLHGFLHYEPGTINRTNGTEPSDAPASGEDDQLGLYCALLTEQLHVDNTDMSTFPDWETDPRVVAYGALPTSQCGKTAGDWLEFDIPLVYRSLTIKPTHLLVVCSSSKYGDYFHGSDASVLYVDDFSLVYGTNPATK